LLGKSANGKGEWLCGRANLDESKLFNIFVMLVGYILIQLENINAPKVGAITPLKGVTDKPLTGGVHFLLS